MEGLICPVCGATNPVEATVCENCSENLNAVKSVMDTANTHYNEALALAHSGRLDEAIAQLEAAIALSGMDPNYHNLLGTVYAQKGLYSESIRAWERALALNPEMEKAYKNIEKARRMEEEAAEEQQKRPFLLTSITASIVAALFLVTTIFFGVRSYFASNRIETMTHDLTTKTNEAQSWKLKYDNMKEILPGGGLDQIMKELTEAKKVAEERQTQLERERDRYTKIVQSRNDEITKLRDQIKTLQTENTQQKQDLQKMNGLQSMITRNNAQIENLQKTIQEKNEEIKKANERTEEMKQKLLIAQQTIETIRQERIDSLDKARKAHEQALEEVHSQILDLRSEIAQHERKHLDMKYANEVLIKALDNLEANEFDLAFQNVQDALNRVQNHPTAIYLHNKLQDIMSNPLEMEMRRQEQMNRERQRAQKRAELVTINLEAAEEYYEQGAYPRAIESARRALALSPSDPDKLEDLNRLIHESEERNRKNAMLVLEAREKIVNGKYREARSLLNKVLRRSASHPEANELMQQLEN